MDNGCRNWLLRTARAQFWKLASWYELDDLIQDGHYLFHYVGTRYKPKNRAHHMSLFMRVFQNHIHDLARNKTRLLEIPATNFERDDKPSSVLEQADPDSRYADVVALAPPELRALLKLAGTEQGIKRLQAAFRVRRDGTRETTNERLRSIIGVKGGINYVGGIEGDIAGRIKEYLRSSRYVSIDEHSPVVT